MKQQIINAVANFLGSSRTSKDLTEFLLKLQEIEMQLILDRMDSLGVEVKADLQIKFTVFSEFLTIGQIEYGLSNTQSSTGLIVADALIGLTTFGLNYEMINFKLELK